MVAVSTIKNIWEETEMRWLATLGAVSIVACSTVGAQEAET